MRYEGASAGPQFFPTDAPGFESALQEWELRVSRWEVLAPNTLNDAVKRQILIAQSPAQVRLRNVVLAYLVSVRTWFADQQRTPMDVGASMQQDDVNGMGAKGKKGKYKGRETGGKGKQTTQQKETRTCRVCGKFGYLARRCWHTDGTILILILINIISRIRIIIMIIILRLVSE